MEQLVAKLRADGFLASVVVESALRAVDRALFLPAGRTAEAYVDAAIVTRVDHSGTPVSSCSQPSVVAWMLELLEVTAGMSVLEIGTGTGWNAGLLAAVAGRTGRISSVEFQPEAAEEARRNLCRAGFDRVVVRVGDGACGLPEYGPFDRIIATAGTPEIFPAWLEQLKPGGRILVPYQIEGLNSPLLRLDLGPNGVTGRFCGETEFMPLQGRPQRKVAIIQERPLLQSLLSKTLRKEPALWEKDLSNDWPKRRSLLFFLHLRDPRVLAVYMGGDNWRSWIGLWDGSEDIALVAEDSVLTFGPGGAYKDLLALHAEWNDLGCPQPESYEVKVTGSPRSGRSWVLERRTPLTCRLP